MDCVISTSFSLSINGNIHGYFKGKWGLRQGDSLSPYLFTLVMEVLTLILKRKVSLSDSFRYHKHCEELQLINVCFADDLFIFAHGDVDSARLIIEALDEFKDTSGLVLSIPKSTVYFCNVVNHVKNSILSSRPFAEVISSMQVYWASDLVIPKGIILDIHQHIRGFLWCNGEYMREKAKVAWSDICLPKSEGGLDLHCVDTFNMALITTHIWNIVSNKESLWVWLYVRHLADMDNIQPIFHNIVAHLQPMAKKRTTQSIIGKLIFAATSYFIWNERNNRLFKKTRRPPKEIRDLIMVTVRVKLISFIFKNKDNVNRSQVEDLFRVWYPNREFQVRVVLFFPSPRFFPLGFPREGFLRRQSCLDHRPPYVGMVDVAAWKLRKADLDLS
ncbi:putative reverse transcriptase domain, reverse transcriptase zinc-binding domain protein [Tanacetum coccineum]